MTISLTDGSATNNNVTTQCTILPPSLCVNLLGIT